MVLGNRIGDRLQQHRLAGTRRRHYERALALADWRYQIDDASREVIGGDLHLQHLVRIKWRQVVEEYFFARLLGRFEVDRLDLNQCEIALAFLWRSNLAADGVAS